MRERRKNRCLFCSLGCGFIIETEFDEAVALEYDVEDDVGKGSLCAKGNYMLELINHPMRLAEPRMGGKSRGWKEVLDVTAGRLKPYAGTAGVGLILDGDASTEDIITAQFFAERCLGNKRIAVHFPTGDDAVYRALASADIPNPLASPEDIEKSGHVLAVGDPFEIAPVIAGRVLSARYADRRNRLTVVSMSPNRTSRFATSHLGGDERKTLAGLLRAVADLKGNDGPDWLRVVREKYPRPEEAAVSDAARVFVENPSSVLLLETQDPVAARLAAALVAAAGPEKKIFTVWTYRNVGGICEHFEGNDTVGGILDSVESGELKALVVLGADIVRGMPGRDVVSALEKLEFLAVGAPFENDTTVLADPVLPTALWLECEGTFGGDLLNPVIEPPGAALSYGEILRRLTAKMGHDLFPVSREPVLKREGMSGDLLESLLEEAETGAPQPAVRSTVLRYADGALTDNMSWMRLQERESW